MNEKWRKTRSTSLSLHRCECLCVCLRIYRICINEWTPIHITHRKIRSKVWKEAEEHLCAMWNVHIYKSVEVDWQHGNTSYFQWTQKCDAKKIETETDQHKKAFVIGVVRILICAPESMAAPSKCVELYSAPFSGSSNHPAKHCISTLHFVRIQRKPTCWTKLYFHEFEMSDIRSRNDIQIRNIQNIAAHFWQRGN